MHKLRSMAGVIVIISAVTALPGIAADAQMDISVIRDGIRQRAADLGTTHVKMMRTIYYVDKPEDRFDAAKRTFVEKRRYDLYRKNRKLLFDSVYLKNDGSVEFINKVAWDGSRDRGYSIREDGSPIQGGLISAAQSGAFSCGHHLSMVEDRVLELPDPLADLVTSDWSVIGKERVGPYEALHVTGPVKNHPCDTLDVWVDPVHSFAPVKMGLVLQVGPDFPRSTDMVEEFQDVGLKRIDGVWVATQGTVLVHNPNVASHWCAFQFDVEEARVGMKLKDDIFCPKFPAGMQVLDDTQKKVFLAKEGGELEFLYAVPQEGPGSTPMNQASQPAKGTAATRGDF